MPLVTAHRAILAAWLLMATAAVAAPSVQASGLFVTNLSSGTNSLSATVIGAPTQVSASGQDQTNVLVEWVASGTPSIDGYRISRSLTSGGPYDLLTIAPADTTSFIDQDLTPDTSYYYIVQTNAANWISKPSVEVVALTDP